MNLYECQHCGEIETMPRTETENGFTSAQCGNCSRVGYLEEMDYGWASEALAALTKDAKNQKLVEALDCWMETTSANEEHYRREFDRERAKTRKLEKAA